MWKFFTDDILLTMHASHKVCIVCVSRYKCYGIAWRVWTHGVARDTGTLSNLNHSFALKIALAKLKMYFRWWAGCRCCCRSGQQHCTAQQCDLRHHIIYRIKSTTKREENRKSNPQTHWTRHTARRCERKLSEWNETEAKEWANFM